MIIVPISTKSISPNPLRAEISRSDNKSRGWHKVLHSCPNNHLQTLGRDGKRLGNHQRNIPPIQYSHRAIPRYALERLLGILRIARDIRVARLLNALIRVDRQLQNYRKTRHSLHSNAPLHQLVFRKGLLDARSRYCYKSELQAISQLRSKALYSSSRSPAGNKNPAYGKRGCDIIFSAMQPLTSVVWSGRLGCAFSLVVRFINSILPNSKQNVKITIELLFAQAVPNAIT